MSMSLEQIKDRLNDSPAEALKWLLRAGVLYGQEFCCGDVLGSAARKGNKGSFQFNIAKLTGKDWAGSQRGYHGVYDVFVAHCMGNQSRAIELAREFLQIPAAERPTVEIGHEQGSRGKKSNSEYDIVQVYRDCPDTAPVIPEKHRHCLAGTWRFERLDGTIAGYSYRIEFEDSRKSRTKLILPLTWCRVRHRETNVEMDRWHNAGLPSPQPLMDVKAVNQAQSVLVLEGEKTRDAGERQRQSRGHPFARFDITTSWHGGTNRLEKIDWSVLHGKDVTFWPDADDPNELTSVRPGFRAGERLPQVLATQGVVPASYRLATPHTDVGGGWDPADPLPRHLDLSWITQKLETAEVYVSP